MNNMLDHQSQSVVYLQKVASHKEVHDPLQFHEIADRVLPRQLA